MPYERRIRRKDPSCFIFLIDQSSSMNQMIGGEVGVSKAAIVADALNRLLSELVLACTQSEEGIYDYFDIAVIGYGAGRASSILGGGLAGRELVSISEIADNRVRVEQRIQRQPDGAGGLAELQVEFDIWIEPRAQGDTPMSLALQKAHNLLRNWVDAHPRSFPPVVLNLTDAEFTDGDPLPFANRLRALSTEDGQVLLFNLHISRASLTPVAFPDNDSMLPDAFARTLFSMSSILPPNARRAASEIGYNVSEGSRGFVYNGDIVSVVQFLDIGSGVTTAEIVPYGDDASEIVR